VATLSQEDERVFRRRKEWTWLHEPYNSKQVVRASVQLFWMTTKNLMYIVKKQELVPCKCTEKTQHYS
jgi:hypothetical protein